MTTTVFIRNQHVDVPKSYRAGLVVDLFDDYASSTVATNIERVLRRLGYPSQNLLDFCLLAIAVYVADKKTVRAVQPDRWTRTFIINMPVQDVTSWRSLGPDICSTLSFLTGDHWNIDFRAGKNVLRSVTRPLKLYGAADLVCLFSGGLDSAIGAIDLLQKGVSLVLISHYDNHWIQRVQRKLVEQLKIDYASQLVHHIQLRVGPAGRRQRQQYDLPLCVESSIRSRSFLFLALGLIAANAISDAASLYVPENGFISLNVPLSRAREGSCSTRTTHPFYFQGVRNALAELGYRIPILNPYCFSTKGEMIEQCTNQTLIRSIAPATISCSHPVAGRFQGLPFGNCGYCLPCIIRRSAMHKARLTDQYNYDVCTNVKMVAESKKGRDVRAVFRGLQRWRNDQLEVGELLSTGPMVGGRDEIQKLLSVHSRAIAEIRQLFVDEASDSVRRIASL